MAYQFIHIDVVSRAGRDIYRRNNGEKVKVGHISIDSVLGEAGRFEGYISHIENPLCPVILYGNKDQGTEVVQQMIKNWVEGTTDARGHSIRKDANALLSGVISWPPIGKDEDEKDYNNRREAFEPDLLNWLKEEYGNELVLALRHDDESFKGLNAGKIHYHWHFFCVKKPGEKFDLHPGFKARSEKDISRKDRENITKEEIKNAMKEGKKAYRQAMVAFQDRFYQKLGRKYALNRMGPMRLRRSRSEQVELEEYIKNEIIEANNQVDEKKAKAEELIANAVSIQKEAKNKLHEAENEASEIKKNAESEAQRIKKAANDLSTKLDEKKRELENMEMAIKDEAKQNHMFFSHVEEAQKKTIRLIQEKLAQSEFGKSILNWLWPKLANSSKSKDTGLIKDKGKTNGPKR